MADITGSLKNLGQEAVVLLGVPTDVRSSFQRGAAEAPARIRRVMLGGSSNMCSEDGTDLDSQPRFRDIGDLELGAVAEIEELIETTIDELLGKGARVLSIGGDHAITHPVLRAYSKAHRGLSVLHLDAHPDLYDEYEGIRKSHACTFARIMEENLVRRLVQVGIRAGNPHQREQADHFGVETITADKMASGAPVKIDGPVYVSLDLDVLDPGFAPGVAHPEPGGLSTRDVIRIIKGISGPIVGADIVELNPGRDSSDLATMAAFKLLKELAAAMLR